MAQEVINKEAVAKKERAPLLSNKAIEEGIKKADELRSDGVDKIEELTSEIIDIKKNREIDDATRSKLITEDKAAIVKAKEVRKNNAPELRKVISETAVLIRQDAKTSMAEAKSEYRTRTVDQNAEYKAGLAQMNAKHKENLAAIQSSDQEKEAKDQALRDENFAHQSQKSDFIRVHGSKPTSNASGYFSRFSFE